MVSARKRQQCKYTYIPSETEIRDKPRGAIDLILIHSFNVDMTSGKCSCSSNVGIRLCTLVNASISDCRLF